MADTLARADRPGLDLCQLTTLLSHTRASGTFSAFVVTSSHGHEMFEVVAPVYRRGSVLATRDGPSLRDAIGWIIGLFDAQPILRSSVAARRHRRLARARARRGSRDPRPDRRRSRVPQLPATPTTRRRALRHRSPAAPPLTPPDSVEADGRWTVSVTARVADRALLAGRPGDARAR